MKKVTHRSLTTRLSLTLLAFLLSFSTLTFGQVPAASDAAAQAAPAADLGGDPVAGKQLFNANCASCHKLYQKATGPALFGVGDKYEKEWLYKWIKNSQELIKSGDARAVAISNEYNGALMNPFPALSNEDIDNIIAYTYTPKPVPTTPVATEQAGGGGGGVSSDIILAVLALVFLMLAIMLFLVNKTLKRIAVANGVEYEDKERANRLPLWKAFAQNQFLVLVSAIMLLLASGYFAYGWMSQVGVDQGYAPVQPIHYSHRIHAGTNQIDCKYCHSSARKSKHSGIPSLNVCMNCHKNIAQVGDKTYQEGISEYQIDYNKEIQKLYDAVGWDRDNQRYTGETKPVKWVRIHNLPDFAYFNHSQHVTVAGVECQTCHGPVEEMEIMYQYSPLTMGWCINCHRETNVKLESNEYYAKIHESLSKEYDFPTLTAAQNGGLECGKCHY